MAFLAGLAGEGRVLELALGTGPLALPLAARGITVEGVEASEATVEKLRAKPVGEQIPVAIGEMADVPAHALVYLVSQHAVQPPQRGLADPVRLGLPAPDFGVDLLPTMDPKAKRE